MCVYKDAHLLFGREGNALDEWLKKYSDIIESTKEPVFVLSTNNQLPSKTGEYNLVIADYGTCQFTNSDVLEVAQKLHHIIAQGGYLIIRLKSMRNPQYAKTKKINTERGLVIDRNGNTEHYFDEAQIDAYFSPYFSIDNLCEELLDENEKDSFVYTGCFRRK